MPIERTTPTEHQTTHWLSGMERASIYDTSTREVYFLPGWLETQLGTCVHTAFGQVADPHKINLRISEPQL